jgi:predicted HTH domain antitoxin
MHQLNRIARNIGNVIEIASSNKDPCPRFWQVGIRTPRIANPDRLVTKYGGSRMSLTITLPNRIEKELESEGGDQLPRKAVEAIAVEGYRSGALSAGEVGEMLGLTINETDGFLKERGLFAAENLEDV